MQSAQATATGPYPPGFEENDQLRSDFIRDLTLRQLRRSAPPEYRKDDAAGRIPMTLVRFWDDPSTVPADVQRCLDSWEELRDAGVTMRMFGDASAARYIASRFGPREVAAFARCRHPAMRSDYLRLCVILKEGGLYVDADDVFRGGDWEGVFAGDALKLHPLCYDLSIHGMVAAQELRRLDLPTDGRIFYVNNNPIAAPAGHPVLRRALARATERLLSDQKDLEIQSTTGPGNLTAALASYVGECLMRMRPTRDVELLLEWELVAEPCWDLAYRKDGRNWRNMSTMSLDSDKDAK